ncbi:MAG: hypothetical protein M3Q23_08060 [Actinomycetota bacterium]|nr:hypothetical protein [Actinomycetota bacterium]
MTPGRLYGLLPAVHRVRDADQGYPLRALLAVVEEQLDVLEGDVEALYENWFVETCQEWVLPYVGDLLRIRGIEPSTSGAFSQRARVANTVAYRRRKGTAAVLEQVARDVTDWPARAVEFFQLLGWNQNVNHLRPRSLRTPDLRDANSLELLGGPFEAAAHTVDVRDVSTSAGRYDIPNVGLFLWRLQPYGVWRSSARAVAEPADGRFWFGPLAMDAPLFNAPQAETEITHLAEEQNVAGVLRRRPLHDELEARRRARSADEEAERVYFGAEPVIRLFVGDPLAEIPPERIMICDLSAWDRPPTQRLYPGPSGQGQVSQPIDVAVDPATGRIAFPAGVDRGQPVVSFSYGFPGDLGGGPYNRRDSVQAWLGSSRRAVTFQVGVTTEQQALDAATDPTVLAGTLGQAIEAWNQHVATHPNPFGIIAVMDSRTYVVEALPDPTPIIIPPGGRLAIVAADWLQVEPSPGAPPVRERGQVVPDGVRPHVLGDIDVSAAPVLEGAEPGELILDGLLVEGRLRVLEGDLGKLTIRHCTLVPARGGLVVDPSADRTRQNGRLGIRLVRTVCGPISLPATVPDLELADCIVGPGAAGAAIAASGSNLGVQASTLLGTCTARTLQAGNSIFAGDVDVERRQAGCVRFSYLTPASHTPRRYRCQPVDLASAGRVVPQFTSVAYGEAAYGQLSAATPPEITEGAEDRGEMGAFRFLEQTQRRNALRAALAEYLRVGLEAGVFFVT